MFIGLEYRLSVASGVTWLSRRETGCFVTDKEGYGLIGYILGHEKKITLLICESGLGEYVSFEAFLLVIKEYYGCSSSRRCAANRLYPRYRQMSLSNLA